MNEAPHDLSECERIARELIKSHRLFVRLNENMKEAFKEIVLKMSYDADGWSAHDFGRALLLGGLEHFSKLSPDVLRQELLKLLKKSKPKLGRPGGSVTF